MNEFTFRKEWYDAVECIDEEYQLDAICAIANYAFFGSEPEWDLPQEIRVLLAVAKPSIDAERNDKKHRVWNESHLFFIGRFVTLFAPWIKTFGYVCMKRLSITD